MTSRRRISSWAAFLAILLVATSLSMSSPASSKAAPMAALGAAGHPDVDTPLVPGSVTPAAPTIDRGQSVTLMTSNTSGGTLPYSYVWLSGVHSTCAGDTVIGGATAQSYAAAPSVNTYYCYNVTDSYAPPETSSSGTIIVLVNSPLVAGSVTPAAPLVDQGNSITLTANPSAGTPPYHFQWYSGTSANCASDTTMVGTDAATYAASPSADTTYCYQVTDSSPGTPATSLSSAVDQVTVGPAVVVGAVTPNAPAIDTGQSVTLTAHASGGTPPYTYAWYEGSSSTCSGDTKAVGTNSTTYVASPTGSAFFCYTVTDGSTASPATPSATDSVTVNSVLSAGAVSPSSPGIDSGQSATLSAEPSGGTLSYAYQWYSGSFPTCSGDALVSGATGSSYTVTPASSTFYCYSVEDSSSTPETATSAADLLSVNTPLVAGAVSPVDPLIDSGSTVVLTANPSEGTAPYHYQWYAGSSATCSDDTTLVGTDSATYAASPTTNTSYCYQVSDSSLGTPATSLLSSVDQVTVNSPLVAGAVTPATPAIDTGQSVTLLAHTSGGTPIATVQWYAGLSVGCSYDTRVLAETGLSYEVSPTTATYYCYAATDGSTNPPTVFSATDLVSVNTVLTAGAVTPSSPTVSSGNSVTLTANPSGGTAPYGFQWYGGNSSTCSSDTVIAGATSATFAPAPTTSTYYCYKVTDHSAGAPAASELSATDHVNVPRPAPGFSFLGLAGAAGAALLGGIVAAALAVVVVFLLLRRRKKRGVRISQLM